MNELAWDAGQWLNPPPHLARDGADLTVRFTRFALDTPDPTLHDQP